MKLTTSYNEILKTYCYQVSCNRCGEHIGFGCGQKANESSIDICRKCALDMYKNELKEGK